MRTHLPFHCPDELLHQIPAIVREVGSPVVVTDMGLIQRTVRYIFQVAKARQINLRLIPPYFVFDDALIARMLTELSDRVSVLIQSSTEYAHMVHAGVKDKQLCVTAGHLTEDSMDLFAGKGIPMTLANLREVTYMQNAHPNTPFNVRIATCECHGPGISPARVYELANLIRKPENLHGLHAYAGAHQTCGEAIEHAEKLLDVWRTYFGREMHLNLSGGYRKRNPKKNTGFGWNEYFYALQQLCKKKQFDVQWGIHLESGRGLLADESWFVTRVEGKPVIRDRYQEIQIDLSTFQMGETFDDPSLQPLFINPNGTLVEGRMVSKLRGPTVHSAELSNPQEVVAGHKGPRNFCLAPQGITDGWLVVIPRAGAYGPAKRQAFHHTLAPPRIVRMPDGSIVETRRRETAEDQLMTTHRTPTPLTI